MAATCSSGPTALQLAAPSLAERLGIPYIFAAYCPDCLAIDDVNHQQLFARVAAVVHHGGAGTTTAAARAGAPQVIIPQLYDQHYWAQRIEQLGVGAAHAGSAPTPDSLTRALERALDPEVTARARSLSIAVASDGALVAAQRMIRSAASHR